MNTTPFSLAMTALLALAVVMALAIGAVPVSLDQLGLWSLRWWPGNAIELPRHVEIVLSDIRAPRLLMGMLIGASLAMAGAAIQGLFRNPLADPGLIGVSSGAALAALAVIVLGNTLLAGWMATLGFLALPLAAFGGALAVTWIIYWIAKRTPGGGQITTLILAGVAITAFAGAVSGILTFLANDAALRSFTFWSMGSLASVTWRDLAVSAPWIVVSLIAFPLLAPALNVLLMGEAVCEHLGIDPHRIRRLVFIFTALAVGAGVSVAGMIGFVGLVVPHLVRLSIGPDHRALIPLSGIVGAALLVWADILARIVVAPAELPIGIITSLIGGPFFLYLLLRQNDRTLNHD
ncbi:iron ABC transporter permease [Saccharospirillum sp. HFRX-1]|uniref:FecCD family ABC transporter permease n=1 Tax=unclassified Saccharospirillum TaxID=2633430 RepID=UPI003711DA63